MKKIMLATCLFFTTHSFAQTSDTINWRANYKLKWEDFKGIADSNSANAALTSTTISYKIIKTDSLLDVIVYCGFNRPWSWSKYKKNQGVLKHEQGHFDISELFARKFREAVRKNKFKDNGGIIVLYGRMMDEKKKYNNQYDIETDYCNDVKKQLFWSKKISAELNKLNAYKQ
jgi:hypothetical protein